MLKDLEKNVFIGIEDVCDMLEHFSGEKDDIKRARLHDDIVFHLDSLKMLLSLFSNDELPKVDKWREELSDITKKLCNFRK